MEYQCLHLSDRFKLAHEDWADVLFETDNLAEAMTYIYHRWQTERMDIAVWQPSTKGYREFYQLPIRNALGQFQKR